MIDVVWDEGFKRIYKKKIKHSEYLQNRFLKAIELFAEDPFNHRLRTHKLTGKLEGLWSFSLDLKYRLVFEFIDDNTVMLVDIGSHDEVY